MRLFFITFLSFLFLAGCAGAGKRTPSTSQQSSHPVNSQESSPSINAPEHVPSISEENPSSSPDSSAQSPPSEIPDSALTEPIENTSQEPEITIEPDLGRRSPYLIYSESLKLYTSPSAQYDIFFSDGVWYVRSRGTWFTAKSHRGPWREIEPSALIPALQEIGQ